MWGKKKEKPRQEKNVYEKKWWDLQEDSWAAYRRLEELFHQIQDCKLVLECFKVGTADYDCEAKHFESLQKSMLCVCGTYDGLQAELIRFYDLNKEKMEERFCLNGLYRPDKNCHHVLREIAHWHNKRK